MVNLNSGNKNSGDMNSGHMNSGHRNSGHSNSGSWNSGNWNSGDSNSGSWNSGHSNSGDRNSGHWNSGDRNSGYMNSGHWNSGDRNSGYMNSNEPTVRMFNKDSHLSYQEVSSLIPDFFYFDNIDWISEEDMTDEEKEQFPEYKTTGGCLKVLDYHQSWRRSWDKATDEDRRKVFNLPNWNNDIFKEITGIDAEVELGEKEKDTNDSDIIEVNGVKYKKVNNKWKVG